MHVPSAAQSLPTADRRKRNWNSLNLAPSFMNSRSLTLPNFREGTPHGKRKTEVDYHYLILHSATTLSEVAESTRWNKNGSIKPVLVTGTSLFQKIFTSERAQNAESTVAISCPDRCLVLRKLSKRIESANNELSEHCRKDEYRCGRRGGSAPPLTRQFCDIMGPGLCNECTKCRRRNISIKEISKNFKQMKTDRPVLPSLLRGAPAHPSIKTYLERGNAPPASDPPKQELFGDSDSDDSVFPINRRARTESFSSRLSNISSMSKEMSEKTAAVRKQRSLSTASVTSLQSDTECSTPRSRKSSVISELGPRLKRVPIVQPVLLELKLINFTPYDSQCLKEKTLLGSIIEDVDEEQPYCE